MNPNEDQLFGMARKLREDNDQFIPVVTYQPKGGDAPVIACVTHGGGLVETMSQALPMLREQFGPAEWFAVTADSYAKVGDTNIEPGALAEAFMMGDPGVVEQLVVMIAEEDGRLSTFRQVYRHTPVDGWEWDKPEIFTDHSTELQTVMLGNI